MVRTCDSLKLRELSSSTSIYYYTFLMSTNKPRDGSCSGKCASTLAYALPTHVEQKLSEENDDRTGSVNPLVPLLLNSIPDGQTNTAVQILNDIEFPTKWRRKIPVAHLGLN